ncbi:MAG: hypothetical protein ACRC6M_04395 [Microcystaceae cyanobacterium]
MVNLRNETLAPPSIEPSDIPSQILALEAENEALKQKIIINELTEEVKEKVSSWVGNVFAITLSLMVLFGFVTFAVLYSVVQSEAKKTAEAEAQRTAQVAVEAIKAQAINDIRKELTKEKTAVINRIAESARDEVTKDPLLLGRMYGIARDTAKNGQTLEKGGFFVVVGSAQTKAILAKDQKLAEKEGFKTLICPSKINDHYVLVLSQQKDKFSLPASQASKILQDAKSKIELFKQNQAFTLPEARAFFDCAQTKKS